MIRTRFDPRGKILELSFWGEQAQPVVNPKRGFAIGTSRYDRFGQEIDDAYYDVAGKPALCIPKKYHRALMEYDFQGRVVHETRYGVSAGPATTAPVHLYECRTTYDEDGNATEIRTIGPDGRLKTDPAIGCAVLRRRFDAKGKVVEESRFGELEQPVLNPETGSYRWIRDYDPRIVGGSNWNYGITREAHFGVRGEPVACKDGYHAYTLNYGDYGPGKAVMVDARGKPLLARVMIGQVRPGQGQQLGFKVGDFLISYDGIEIETVDQIAKIVLNGNPSLPPRPIVLWRAGRELTFSITPGPTGCDWLPRPAPPELAARLGRGGR